jgi:Flp pilus assembly CpaE family ATPase
MPADTKLPEKTGVLIYAASPDAARRLSTTVLASGRYTPADFDAYRGGGQLHAGIVDIGDGAVLDGPAIGPMQDALKGAPLIVVSAPLSPERTRQLLRLGAADWLQLPYTDADIIAALGQATGGTKSALVTTFVPASGGAGATSMTLLAAGAATRQSKSGRTCIVDLDYQAASCAAYLNATSQFDLDALLENPDRLDTELLELMKQARDPRISLYSFERPNLYFHPLAAKFVLRLLDLAAGSNSNVLVDLPNLRTPWFGDVIRHSDKVYIVCELNVPSLGHARRLLSEIVAVRGGSDGIEAIVNKAEFKLFGNVIARGDVEKMFGTVPFRTVAEDAATMADAINRGLLASEVAPRSRMVREAGAIFAAALGQGSQAAAK